MNKTQKLKIKTLAGAALALLTSESVVDTVFMPNSHDTVYGELIALLNAELAGANLDLSLDVFSDDGEKDRRQLLHIYNL